MGKVSEVEMIEVQVVGVRRAGRAELVAMEG